MKIDIPIPDIEEQELLEAVSALMNSAGIMRNLLFKVISGQENPETLMKEHGQILLLGDAVIDRWDDYISSTEIHKKVVH